MCILTAPQTKLEWSSGTFWFPLGGQSITRLEDVQSLLRGRDWQIAPAEIRSWRLRSGREHHGSGTPAWGRIKRGHRIRRNRREAPLLYRGHSVRGAAGGGSGVIWSSDGSIITNAHMARGMHVKIQLWDGRGFDAVIASRDARRDLALLRIGATNLPSVSVADSSQVRLGELAIAIGNPLGFVGALTTGVVHTVGPVRGLGSQSWVQADVRLAPGNSGGPLADARGYLIGINTMIAGRLALAIPSNAVRDFLSTGPSDAWLGVTIHPVRIPRRNSTGASVQSFGLLLCEVDPDSPASSASLMPGDILLGTEEQALCVAR